MEIKAGYIKTDFGIMPDDWNLVEMSSIGDPIIGLTYSPEDVARYGKLVHRASNINNNKLVYEDNVYVNKEVNEKLLLQENDILICVRNGSRALIGKSALITGDSIGETFGAFMSIFRTSECAPFIFQLVISNIVQRQIARSLGATINQITNKTLKALQIPLPPTLEEQRAIATALSDTDELISSLDKLITKKRNIKQAAMQQLLTGKKRLPGFGGEWVVKNLGEECITITKGTTPTSLGEEFKERGINFIKVESLQEDGKINKRMIAFIDFRTHTLLKRSQLKENDLLISIAGALGRTGIINEDILPANTNQALAIVRLREDSNFFLGYLYYFLRTEKIYHYIEKISVQGAQPNLSLQNIFDLPIEYPIKQEQTAIAKVLSDMDSEIETLEQKRDKYKAIKQGMMQQLLTGKIRLVNKEDLNGQRTN